MRIRLPFPAIEARTVGAVREPPLAFFSARASPPPIETVYGTRRLDGGNQTNFSVCSVPLKPQQREHGALQRHLCLVFYWPNNIGRTSATGWKDGACGCY